MCGHRLIKQTLEDIRMSKLILAVGLVLFMHQAQAHPVSFKGLFSLNCWSQPKHQKA